MNHGSVGTQLCDEVCRLGLTLAFAQRTYVNILHRDYIQEISCACRPRCCEMKLVPALFWIPQPRAVQCASGLGTYADGLSKVEHSLVVILSEGVVSLSMFVMLRTSSYLLLLVSCYIAGARYYYWFAT